LVRDSQIVENARCALGEKLATHRRAAGHSQAALAKLITYSRSTVANVEIGRQHVHLNFWRRADEVLQAGGALIEAYNQLEALIRQEREAMASQGRQTNAEQLRHSGDPDAEQGGYEDIGYRGHHIELLRQGLNDSLGAGTLAAASLDEWERTVADHGRATRDLPASVLLSDLSTDLAELKQALDRYRSASALRRLTRVAAQMAGLMCLTLCKLDDRPSFRRWVRTARLAAHEAADQSTQSWILAQEAYGLYYGADLRQAVDVARQAQDIAGKTPNVGAALAAALEARACAAMGLARETRAALGRAEDILSHLEGEELLPSAFGYNEAQLRFHEGSAYTLLHDVKAALQAQARALELCASGDYMDWAMTRLDRASCLALTGDSAFALSYAAETLGSLTEPQRRGIITVRGYQILKSLPTPQRALPGAHDLRDLLMLTAERKEVPNR
jgi:transcriptional regulator with XRE-family HTH domain